MFSILLTPAGSHKSSFSTNNYSNFCAKNCPPFFVTFYSVIAADFLGNWRRGETHFFQPSSFFRSNVKIICNSFLSTCGDIDLFYWTIFSSKTELVATFIPWKEGLIDPNCCMIISKKGPANSNLFSTLKRDEGKVLFLFLFFFGPSKAESQFWPDSFLIHRVLTIQSSSSESSKPLTMCEILFTNKSRNLSFNKLDLVWESGSGRRVKKVREDEEENQKSKCTFFLLDFYLF